MGLIDEVWKKIQKNENKTFKTKRGVSFKYTILDDVITPHPIDGSRRHYSNDVMSFKKRHIEKAIKKVPIENYDDLRDVLGIPTWLYALMTDERIINKFQKKIRWNSKKTKI